MKEEDRQRHKIIKLHIETSERLDKLRFDGNKKMSYDGIIHVLLDAYSMHEIMLSLAKLIDDLPLSDSIIDKDVDQLMMKVDNFT